MATTARETRGSILVKALMNRLYQTYPNLTAIDIDELAASINIDFVSGHFSGKEILDGLKWLRTEGFVKFKQRKGSYWLLQDCVLSDRGRQTVVEDYRRDTSFQFLGLTLTEFITLISISYLIATTFFHAGYFSSFPSGTVNLFTITELIAPNFGILGGLMTIYGVYLFAPIIGGLTNGNSHFARIYRIKSESVLKFLNSNKTEIVTMDIINNWNKLQNFSIILGSLILFYYF